MTEKIEQNLISIIHASFEDETNQSLVDAKKALQKFRDRNFHFNGEDNEKYFYIIGTVREALGDLTDRYQQKCQDARSLKGNKDYQSKLRLLSHAEPVISRLGLDFSVSASTTLVDAIKNGEMQEQQQPAFLLGHLFFDQGICYEVGADFLELNDAIEHLEVAKEYFSNAHREFSYVPFNREKVLRMAEKSIGVCKKRIEILSYQALDL